MKWNVMSRGRGTTTLAIKDKRVHTAKKKSQAKANCSVDEIKTFQG